MTRKDAELRERGAKSGAEKPKGLSRRSLLKGVGGAALAAAGASLASVISARAQVGGLEAGPVVPTFRLPTGSLSYLDRKQYSHNMEVVSHISGATISGGEPLMALWARGKQRLLPAAGGWVDISDPKKPVLMNKGVIRGNGTVTYNTKLKKWIMMCTAAAPLTSATPEYPNGAYDKPLRDKSTGYKGLRGIRNYDITDPAKPNMLQEFNTGEKGNGTHHNFYDGGKYAYLDCGWDDQLRLENHQRPYSNALMIVDMSDPANVQEVSRWWVPGQRLGEEDEYKKYIFANDHSSWTGNHGAITVPKRVEDGGTLGYGGFGAFGMYVMDLSDIKKPKPAGHVQYEFNAIGAIPFHTCYPLNADAAHPRLQNMVVAVHEALEADCREVYHTPYMVDVKDPHNPKIAALFPRPKAPESAPYSDFCFARGRFGSHNTQCWLAPGTERPEIMSIAWFDAGLRVFDLSNPLAPKEGGVLCAASRRRNGELRQLVAGNVGELLCGVGSKFDLGGVPRRKLLPLLPGAGEAGARTTQSGEVDGRALQHGLGRSNTAQRVLRQIDQPDGVASWPPVSGLVSLGPFSSGGLTLVSVARWAAAQCVVADASTLGSAREITSLTCVFNRYQASFADVLVSRPQWPQRFCVRPSNCLCGACLRGACLRGDCLRLQLSVHAADVVVGLGKWRNAAILRDSCGARIVSGKREWKVLGIPVQKFLEIAGTCCDVLLGIKDIADGEIGCGFRP